MAYNTYSLLTTEILAWSDRAGDPVYVAKTDNFIANAEAEMSRYLNTFEMELSTTITTNSSGVGTLPADFSVMRSLTYSTWGPLKQVSFDANRFLNPLNLSSGPPYHYALSGASLYIDRAMVAALTAVYVANIAPLTSLNTTNWLLTAAPDAYLFMCLAQGEAFNKNWQEAAGLEGKGKAILDEIISQANLAQYGRAEMTLRGVSP